MKKSLIICFIVFLALLSVFIILKKSSKKANLADNHYIKTLTKENLSTGMRYQEVEHNFGKMNIKLNLWECAEDNIEHDGCAGEKSIVGVIPLKSNNFLLGKGEAQIYLYFDADNILLNYDYELYYSKLH